MDDELPFSRNKFRKLQKAEPDLDKLSNAANDRDSEFYLTHGILIRKWIPQKCNEENAEWQTVNQVVVPQGHRENILKLAHDSSLAGHLGVQKTLNCVWRNFWWPGVCKDTTRYCKTCHTCQLVGKCNQSVKRAPLIPVLPFNEPFSRLVVDIVGPLLKTTSGNVYILTMATRYLEAIPIRSSNPKL